MLNEEQKQKVSDWIADGTKLSDIQSRLADECGIRLTYMEARLLVDDLKLTPKDPVVEAPPAPPAPVAVAAPELPPAESAALPAEGGGKVTVAADTIAMPGMVVSGTVTFSDGKVAKWYLDQTGRLGVVPQEEGYRPPEGDVPEFQALLDQQLAKLGY